MAEKPILFNTLMVQAILDGRKTQTRRVVKPKYSDSVFEIFKGVLCETEPPTPPIKLENGMTQHKVRRFVECEPRYQPGDILWVRESFCPNYFDDYSPAYKADYDKTKIGDVVPEAKWKPSIHMPRAAARIFLRVTDVRAERVQDISGRDALSEGVDNGKSNPAMGVRWDNMQRMAFADLWDSLNTKRGYGWDVNPWIWVYEFERIDRI